MSIDFDDLLLIVKLSEKRTTNKRRSLPRKTKKMAESSEITSQMKTLGHKKLHSTWILCNGKLRII